VAGNKHEKEARKSARISHQILVYIEEKDDYFVTQDLSSNGCRILMPEPLPAGSEVHLTFSLPGDKTVNLKGVVRHTGRNDAIGVEFTDLGVVRKTYLSFLNALSTFKEGKTFFRLVKEQLAEGRKQRLAQMAQKAGAGIRVLNTVFIVVFLGALLFAAAQHLIISIQRGHAAHEFATKQGAAVITMIHRQETVGLFGVPMKQYIQIEDAEAILRAIRKTPTAKPIDLVLHTPGGMILPAYQIARALREHQGPVTVFVPHYAMSGGTLIALAADRIVMDKDAVLGPLDPQMIQAKTQLPAISLVDIPKYKKWGEIDDMTVVRIDQARKAIQQVKDMIRFLLRGRMDEAHIQKVVDRLVGGHVTHDYPIFPDEATALGLPISTDMPAEVYRLMDLFPQPSNKSVTRAG